MERERYIEQYREVKETTKGMTMDEVREHFGDNVSNDFVEGGVRIIDTNYKDILVTFSERDGNVELSNFIEMYSSDDVFIGATFV